AGNGWWWIPIVAPMVGAVLGALVYELLVELHHLEAKSGPTNYADEETLKGTDARGKDGPAIRRDKAGADDQFVMAM
ncbi:hypothetical protein chiPu_0030747, partial [Chiloscyllium punctatum]|nr:hypothetical protein [Chiloscyllium punctatum]